MHNTIAHPTEHIAFRRLISAMGNIELDEYEKIIHDDIVKYIDSQAQREYIEDWSVKIKLIAEERKCRRERINFDSNKAA